MMILKWEGSLRPRALTDVLSHVFAPELRAWRGEAPLVLVFWFHGVCISLILVGLVATALDMGRTWLVQALIPFGFVYTLWVLIAIWRCASNARPFWGMLARGLTFAWALNVTFVLFFLELDLLVRHVRK